MIRGLRSASRNLRCSITELNSNNKPWNLGFSSLSQIQIQNQNQNRNMSSSSSALELSEVEKILSDVRADDVKVIPVKKGFCDWADCMVIATGRSTWHVKNIAQALIYKAKQKQKGARRMILPTVQGQEGGKWIVVDSGKVIVHALDEKARAYYNLEDLWTSDASASERVQDLERAFVKIRPKNNSKKRHQISA